MPIPSELQRAWDDAVTFMEEKKDSSLYFGKISISSKDTNAEEVVTDKINGFIYDSKLKDGFFEQSVIIIK